MEKPRYHLGRPVPEGQRDPTYHGNRGGISKTESKLVKTVKAMGGLAPKFVSPGLDGVPDRLVLLPKGHIAFIEVKAPGKELRPLQVRRKTQLEALGFSVYCIDEPEQIEEVLNEIQSA